jgi:hypothetical protein
MRALHEDLHTSSCCGRLSLPLDVRTGAWRFVRGAAVVAHSGSDARGGPLLRLRDHSCRRRSVARSPLVRPRYGAAPGARAHGSIQTPQGGLLRGSPRQQGRRPAAAAGAAAAGGRKRPSSRGAVGYGSDVGGGDRPPQPVLSPNRLCSQAADEPFRRLLAPPLDQRAERGASGARPSRAPARRAQGVPVATPSFSASV